MGGPRLVQWSRFSDAWQRLFGLQGTSQLNVIDDCFLTLPVEEDGPHLAYLRGWKPFADTVSQALVAAQFARVRLSVGSPNLLLVVDGISVYSNGAGETRGANVGWATSSGLGGSVPVRDPRLAPGAAGLPTVAGPSIFGENAVASAILGRTALIIPYQAPSTIGTGGVGTSLCPWVVTNARDLVVETQVVADPITVSIWGRFRELTPQEI